MGRGFLLGQWKILGSVLITARYHEGLGTTELST